MAYCATLYTYKFGGNEVNEDLFKRVIMGYVKDEAVEAILTRPRMRSKLSKEIQALWNEFHVSERRYT